MAINSAAVTNPPLLGEIAAKFGSQCTVLAIDASRYVSLNLTLKHLVAPVLTERTRTTDDKWEVITKAGTHHTVRTPCV